MQRAGPGWVARGSRRVIQVSGPCLPFPGSSSIRDPGRWGRRSVKPGLPTPGSCLLKPPKCPGLDHTPFTSLQIQNTMCLEKGLEEMPPWFTGPPLGGGTMGKEEGRSFSDCSCFLQADIDHMCNLKHQYLQPAQQLHSQVYT